MKIKLISFMLVLICIFSVTVAGLFSVHRSEGRVLSPEAEAKLEAFLGQYGIELPEFPELPDFLAQ